MSKSTSNVPAKKEAAGAVSTDVLDEFDHGASGLERVTANDLLIPRISILQDLSPQLKKSKPEYIEGAELGDFCDTGINEVFKDELHILPVYFATVYLEWAPNRGGLVHNHGTDASIMAKTQKVESNGVKYVLPNGNYVVETATYYVLNLSAQGRRSFIPLSSSGLRASRRWMTKITGEKITRPDGTSFTPPIFYRSWFAKSVLQSNEKGEWHTWTFEPGPTVLELDASKNLLKEAKDFYEQARDGLVQGDVSGVEGEAGGADAPQGDNAPM